MKISIAYIGSPTFSAQFLERILKNNKEDIHVECVITQPDKPIGRNKIVTPTPVKKIAQDYNVAVYENLSLVSNATWAKCDIALVFAYGKIIDKDYLRAPKHGFWNIHPSLLPHYRGASPVVYPLIFGEEKTGTSLMLMDDQMDHGTIIAQNSISIPADIIHDNLLNKLADMSYYMFCDTVSQIKTETFKCMPQDNEKATYTKTLSREDGFIEYSILTKLIGGSILEVNNMPKIITDFLKKNPTYVFDAKNQKNMLWNLYRGLTPWPGIWTLAPINNQEKRLKIVEMNFNDGVPLIEKVQIEGKKPVSFAESLLKGEMSP